jgi:hypothetical protein
MWTEPLVGENKPVKRSNELFFSKIFMHTHDATEACITLSYHARKNKR